MRSAGNNGIFRRDNVHFVLFAEGASVRCRIPADRDRDFPAEIMKGAYIMKIVVLKSPKLFAGLLRAMFGIKKQPVD